MTIGNKLIYSAVSITRSVKSTECLWRSTRRIKYVSNTGTSGGYELPTNRIPFLDAGRTGAGRI
jgi:hypothetical protein